MSKPNVLIEDFEKESFDDDDLKNSDEEFKNILEEKRKFDRLIVMNDAQV